MGKSAFIPLLLPKKTDLKQTGIHILSVINTSRSKRLLKGELFMKKQITKTLLGFGIALMLTACGNTAGGSGTTPPSPETTTSSAAASEATDTEKPASQAEEAFAAVSQKVPESAQKEEADETVVIRVGGAPSAPPTFPILHMMEDNLLGDNIQIEMDVWNSPEQLIAMVQDGGHDIFAFPLNVVSKLYNKGLPVRLTNVNTWGVVYLMTTDPDCKDWSDLKNKSIYLPLQSSPPDVVAQYFMTQSGVRPGEDVEIIYTGNSAELMASGEADYAVMVEPSATIAMSHNPDVIRVSSFTDDWKRFTGGEKYPNAGLGGMASFYQDHPAEAAAFEKAYAESVQWINDNPAEAAALVEKYLGLKAPIVEKAIPYMGLEYQSAVDSSEELADFYQVLFDFDHSTVGGKVPDEGLLYDPQAE